MNFSLVTNASQYPFFANKDHNGDNIICAYTDRNHIHLTDNDH